MIDERLCPRITERHSVTLTCVGGGDQSLNVSRWAVLQRTARAGVAAGE